MDNCECDNGGAALVAAWTDAAGDVDVSAVGELAREVPVGVDVSVAVGMLEPILAVDVGFAFTVSELLAVILASPALAAEVVDASKVVLAAVDSSG